MTAVRAFQARNGVTTSAAIAALQRVAATGGNVFGELMEAVQVCSLGQISRGLYLVGGQYRRNV